MGFSGLVEDLVAVVLVNAVVIETTDKEDCELPFGLARSLFGGLFGVAAVGVGLFFSGLIGLAFLPGLAFLTTVFAFFVGLGCGGWDSVGSWEVRS